MLVDSRRNIPSIVSPYSNSLDTVCIKSNIPRIVSLYSDILPMLSHTVTICPNISSYNLLIINP